jgi:polyribonucleotide nucleotidyltransferase
MEKIQALIDKKQSQISKLDEDEDMKDLTDDKKVKEISKDIKALEKAKAKLEKIISKFKEKKPESKKVIDEIDNAEEAVSDIAPEYIKDANERLENGEEIDSILSNYQNLSFDDRNHLKNYLNWKQGEQPGLNSELGVEDQY